MCNHKKISIFFPNTKIGFNNHSQEGKTKEVLTEESGRKEGWEYGRKEGNEIKSRHNKPKSSLKNCLNDEVGCIGQYVLVGSLHP